MMFRDWLKSRNKTKSTKGRMITHILAFAKDRTDTDAYIAELIAQDDLDPKDRAAIRRIVWEYRNAVEKGLNGKRIAGQLKESETLSPIPRGIDRRYRENWNAEREANVGTKTIAPTSTKPLATGTPIMAAVYGWLLQP